MKTFYLASGLERGEEAKALAAQLEAMGFRCSYEWWTHGSVQAAGSERIAEVAVDELEGVRGADLFIALLPGGRGTHTEFGCALTTKLARRGSGYGTRVIVLVGPTEDASGRTNCFYLHPVIDERFATPPEFVAWLKGWRVANPLPELRHA